MVCLVVVSGWYCSKRIGCELWVAWRCCGLGADSFSGGRGAVVGLAVTSLHTSIQHLTMQLTERWQTYQEDQEIRWAVRSRIREVAVLFRAVEQHERIVADCGLRLAQAPSSSHADTQTPQVLELNGPGVTSTSSPSSSVSVDRSW